MENRRPESGYRYDKLGVMKPVGSGANWKEFFKISSDQSAVAANIFARSRLPADCWPDLALATSLATYTEKLIILDKDKKPVVQYRRIVDPEHLVYHKTYSYYFFLGQELGFSPKKSHLFVDFFLLSNNQAKHRYI